MLGWCLSKDRKDILRVLKPAFKEQIWILRLENASNCKSQPYLCNTMSGIKVRVSIKVLKTRKQGFETAGNAQEASG